jgi:hypothetical protein
VWRSWRKKNKEDKRMKRKSTSSGACFQRPSNGSTGGQFWMLSQCFSLHANHFWRTLEMPITDSLTLQTHRRVCIACTTWWG